MVAEKLIPTSTPCLEHAGADIHVNSAMQGLSYGVAHVGTGAGVEVSHSGPTMAPPVPMPSGEASAVVNDDATLEVSPRESLDCDLSATKLLQYLDNSHCKVALC